MTIYYRFVIIKGEIMTLDKQYIELHKNKGCYFWENQNNGCRTSACNGMWVDNIIDENLIYSHRKNSYTKSNFTEGLHTHEYFELIIYISGNVEYVKDDLLITPTPYSIIWFLPSQMHTARLKSSSEYERHVFYFSKDFFKFNNVNTDILNFTDKQNIFAECSDYNIVQTLLNKISYHLNSNTNYGGLLTKAYITELFGIFNADTVGMSEAIFLDDAMMQIKNYIDANYAMIQSTYELSEKFYCSREHLSRTFKKSFNISISDYIAKRRVLESLPLLSKLGGAKTSYTVGFKSQSSYIRAFVKNMGCLPSEYKNRSL